MTLNGVMALILRYFTEFGSFVEFVKVVEYVVVKKFTLAISSPDEFLVTFKIESACHTTLSALPCDVSMDRV